MNMSSFSRPRAFAPLFCAVWMAAPGAVRSQQPAAAGFDAARIPKQDVVVFVDVSGSITPSAGEEAGRLVLKLITGQLRPDDFPRWNLTGAPMQYPHFRGFLDGSAGGAGLTEPGRTISIERIGDLRRVREMRNQFPVRTFPGDVERVMLDWPTGPLSYVDQETYLNMAKAKARDYMRRSGEDGFYLFIVTDGADSQANDLKKYTRDQLSYISEMQNNDQREHLITRIDRTDLDQLPEIGKALTPINKKPYPVMGQYFIEWYAVGSKQPKALEAAAPPPPPPVIAPELPRAIQLLGGLKNNGGPEEAKLYRTSQPYLAWQVANYTGMEPVGFDVEVMRWKNGQAEGLVAPSQPRSGSEFTRSDLGKMANENNIEGFQPRNLEDGDYQVTIRPDNKSKNRLKPGEAERLKAVTFIRVSRRLPWWPWVAGAGALCGAALFYHMWRTLGTRRVVS